MNAAFVAGQSIMTQISNSMITAAAPPAADRGLPVPRQQYKEELPAIVQLLQTAACLSDAGTVENTLQLAMSEAVQSAVLLG